MAPRRGPEDRPLPRRTPMAARPGRRGPTKTAATTPAAPGAMSPEVARAGRRAAIVMAATGIFWALATWAGGAWGLSGRVRALFDLIALAGFGLGLWMTFQLWRARQRDVE